MAAIARGNTAGKLVGAAAQLIMRGGYNGFSYADLAKQFGIRKASIHHHFPSKLDLVVTVVEQGRARIGRRSQRSKKARPTRWSSS